jgi:phenylpyruvate tautomerase PptA (4-oxalocrotonate tautomerase family)
MPMIDVYASEGTFSDTPRLAQDLASAVMRWEQVPNLALFRDNTVAFVHEMPATAISTVAGRNDYVRVQVLTPVGALDRDKQLGVARTCVLITESPEGGWGLAGHANTGADIAEAARRELSGR